MLERFNTGSPEAIRKLNMIVDAVNALTAMTGDGMIQVNQAATGGVIKLDLVRLMEKLPTFGSGGNIADKLKFFKVQESTAFDAVYLCRECGVESSEWESTDGGQKYYEKDAIAAWSSGTAYEVDDGVSYGGSYFRCILKHTSDSMVTPANSTNWTRLYPWKVASGAWSDAAVDYAIDDAVTYNGKHYICYVAHASAVGKEPDTYISHWHEMWKSGDYVWNSVDDDIVLYECISTHVSAAAKEPPNRTYWDDVHTKEVWNMKESYLQSDYSAALAKYDLIYAFPSIDNGSTRRWVGIPCVPSVRIVKAAADAGATKTLLCNIILANGTEAVEGELGYNITVNAKTNESANLNAAVPRIADDDELFAVNIEGKWWFDQLFQASDDCICDPE